MNPSIMRASVLLGKGHLQLEERQVPEPKSDEVLVKVLAVGVCGSDVHYYREGRIGDFVVDSPLVLGHELSGVIVGVGTNVDRSRIGHRVAVEPQRPCRTCTYCRRGQYNLCPEMEFFATPPIDGAFCEYVTIQSDFAHAVPDDVSDEAAALCEPLSVGIAALRKARVSYGSRVLVTGAGPIGIICAQAARAFGASEIIMTDVIDEKLDRAKEFGATHAFNPAHTAIEELDLSVDAFIDASGAAPAVYSGMKAVRPGGRAVLVGMGAPDLTLPADAIQNLEVTVTGVFRYTDTWPTAITMVKEAAVNLDDLVTNKFPLVRVQDALESDTERMNLKSIVYPQD